MINSKLEVQINNNSDNFGDGKQDPGVIVFVPEKQFDYSFWDAVFRSGFDVFIFETAEEVRQLVKTRTIETIYIHSKFKLKYLPLITQLKNIDINISVVFYSSVKDIIVTNKNFAHQHKIIKDNFKLMTTLLSDEYKPIIEHINDVVMYTELLCERLYISENQRLTAIASAYVHSFSRFVMDSTVEYKYEKEVVKLSSQCLKTMNYTPEICSLLNLMYIDINTAAALTDDLILANILTAADFYCHSEYNHTKISPEQFKQLHEAIQTKVGSLFLPEIGQELCNLLYDTIEISQAKSQSCNVLIYNEQGQDHLMLESCLENMGFNAKIVSSIDELKNSYNNDNLDILVIQTSGTVSQVSELIDKIEENNISFENVTTYLLTKSKYVFELTELFLKGIEDIFSVEKDLDPFLIKIIRAKKRFNDSSQNKLAILEKMGTFGTLADMNLIDLLQTMNGSGKTCLINITANSNQLSIYVHNGIITYAKNDDVKGKDAIFKGMKWEKGIWNVDPIDLKNFPSPNIDLPINSILLEGCQNLDESQKVETNLDTDLDETFNFLDQ